MGIHLLSLSELRPVLQHLVSDDCIARVAQSYLGRSLARSLRAVNDDVLAVLGEGPADRSIPDDDWLGDLSRFPGYAVMALEYRCAGQRAQRSMLWSALDPTAPVTVDALPGADEHPARTELRMRAVLLLNDLRQGLRIEARYRPLPVDLDALLFGPLDTAVRRRRERLDRSGRRALHAVVEAPGLEPRRREGPTLGAGPVGH